jgi:hypothetical protein
MFWSYDHLQGEIYTSEINTADNGSVGFRILVNLLDNSDRFLVSVNVVALGELTIVCCCCCCQTKNILINLTRFMGTQTL